MTTPACQVLFIQNHAIVTVKPYSAEGIELRSDRWVETADATTW